MENVTDGPSTLDYVTLGIASAGLLVSAVLGVLRALDRSRRLKIKIKNTCSNDPEEPDLTLIHVRNHGLRVIEVEGWEFRGKADKEIHVHRPAMSAGLEFPATLGDGGGFSLYFLTDDLIDARGSDSYRWFMLHLAGGLEARKRMGHRWPISWFARVGPWLRRVKSRFRAWRWKRNARARRKEVSED